MRKEDKDKIIVSIGETLKQYTCVYLAETTGMDAEKTSDFRRACFKSDIKLLVCKNTLLKKAMDASDVDYSGLYPALKGATSLMLCNTGNAPAKLLKKFVKKGDKLPVLKAALVEESVYMGAEQLDFLSSLKSKNELIAEVIALLQSPAKNVVSALQSSGNKLHGILETLSKKEQ
ncbi:MAG: 50S ribosomal protein L10 [Muribaculaceae bacterium]|jgi:large subunit ribosomal protein L10|nr:50S ribosomal protein L10 [Muribaculaceae bacterium]